MRCLRPWRWLMAFAILPAAGSIAQAQNSHISYRYYQDAEAAVVENADSGYECEDAPWESSGSSSNGSSSNSSNSGNSNMNSGNGPAVNQGGGGGGGRPTLADNSGNFSDVIQGFGDFFDPGYQVSDGTDTITVRQSGARRFKLAEYSSPLPQDRIFVSYNFFKNAQQGTVNTFGATDVHRYVVGFEKTRTIGGVLTSLEARLPFFNTSDSVNGPFGVDGSSAIGNLQLTGKMLLMSTERSALSTGLGVSIPIANDVTVFNGGSQLTIENEMVNLLPYIGHNAVFGRGNRFFTQNTIQMDLLQGQDNLADAGGNVLGEFQSQNWLFFDTMAGVWLFRNPYRNARVQGLALLTELHYSTSVTDFNSLSQSGVTVNNFTGRSDILTAVAGGHFQMRRGDLRFGVAVPLTNAIDNASTLEETPFDWELMVQYGIRTNGLFQGTGLRR